MKDAVRSCHGAIDSFKCQNPLLVRKKFQMKDVYYRRDDPEKELFRCEFAFDTEQYLIVIGAVILLAAIACRIASCMKKAAMRRSLRRGIRARESIRPEE